eukprot:1963662-Amphidinium_carterae.2
MVLHCLRTDVSFQVPRGTKQSISQACEEQIPVRTEMSKAVRDKISIVQWPEKDEEWVRRRKTTRKNNWWRTTAN